MQQAREGSPIILIHSSRKVVLMASVLGLTHNAILGPCVSFSRFKADTPQTLLKSEN